MKKSNVIEIIGLLIEAIRDRNFSLGKMLMDRYAWTREYIEAGSNYYCLKDIIKSGFDVDITRPQSLLREERGLKPLLVVIVRSKTSKKVIHFRFEPIGKDKFRKIH